MKSFFVPVFINILLSACVFETENEPLDYYFDGVISEQVLNNYLDRAVTASEFLVSPQFLIDGVYPDKQKDVQLFREIGAKFIGRSIFRWGHEESLNDPIFWSSAKKQIEEIHEFDQDVIFQAAVFEAVYKSGLEKVIIPDRVFEVFDLPVQKRCFDYEAMLPVDGSIIRDWGGGGTVPDITRTETQMWFYFLMTSFIDIGVESFHLGQIHLIGANDHNWNSYASVLQKVRDYAAEHARRHCVLYDAHTKTGMIRDGVSLLDFNSFPMRPVEDEHIELGAKLEFSERFIYGKKISCMSPEGWKTDALPYLVEFDNYGIGDNPGKYDPGIRIWGYDEISWFYLLPFEEKKHFLHYAHDWLLENDPHGHLQMPVARVITTEKGKPTRVARAIEASDSCPTGMGIGNVIKEIWTR